MPPRYLLLLLFLGVLLATVIQLEIISIAFQKLGLSPRSCPAADAVGTAWQRHQHSARNHFR